MLVLTRQAGEEIVIGDDIRLKVVAIVGSQVRLGIEAPPEVAVFRREIYEEICRQNLSAAQASPASLRAVVRKRQETAEAEPVGKTATG